MKRTTHNMLSVLVLIVFSVVSVFSPVYSVFAEDNAFSLDCSVKIGDNTYSASVNTFQKTMTVYFDASNTTPSQLANAEVTISSNEGYITSDGGNIQDLSSPVIYTFENAGEYTLTAVKATVAREYDAQNASIGTDGKLSEPSTDSTMAIEGTAGSVTIGSDGTDPYIRISKNAGSTLDLVSRFKSANSQVYAKEFSLSYRLRVAEVTQGSSDKAFAYITTSCIDQLMLSTDGAENGKFYFGYRDATGKNMEINKAKAFDINSWYNIEFCFKKLREADTGEDPYTGYSCELYVNGEYFCEFAKGVTGWRIPYVGRFTYNATNYEHMGIRGFTNAQYKIDIDNFKLYLNTGAETLIPDPVPEDPEEPEGGSNGDVGSDGNVGSDGDVIGSDGNENIPEILDGPIDYNFEFAGEGWITTNYNIIVNGGFEEIDENGWRKGTTDMADVGYTTEKAYSGNQSSYMFFPDEFPAGSKNTDNAYGAFRDYGVYSIVPFATYDISMAVIASGINNDARHNAQLSFRTTNDAAGNKSVQGEEGGFCKITEDVSEWTVVRGRYKPTREDEKYVTQLCTRMRGTNGTKGYFDDLYFGTMQRVVKNTETGMENASYSGNGLMQIGAYNETYGPQEVKSISVECQESKTYLLSAWTKTDALSASSKIKVEFLDEAGGVINTYESNDCVNTDWTKLNIYATAPKGAKNLRMVLCAEGCGLIDFDSVSLEPQQSVETSFSGIVPGKLGLPKSNYKTVTLTGKVLDQFGTDMEVTPLYELTEAVSGVSLLSNVITLTSSVTKGSVIKVKATYGGLSQVFEWYVDDIVSYVISGNNKIKLPSDSCTESYSAIMKNHDGDTSVLSDGQVSWYIENPQKGISVNKSGVLSVAKDAPLGEYVLAAKWLSDPEYIAELKINIYKEATIIPGGSASGSGSGGSASGSPSFIPVNPDAANSVPNAPSIEQSGTKSLYNDLTEYHWAYNEIAEFTKKGIINGKGNGNFDTEGMVTRAEFIKILLGALGIEVIRSDDILFNDVKTDVWYAPYVNTGVKLNLISGKGDNTFAPDEAITRQDAATIIYRALLASGIVASAEGTEFIDSGEVSLYAKDAVSALASHGIINGVGDGTFRPLENTTRAQAVVILYRLCNMLP